MACFYLIVIGAIIIISVTVTTGHILPNSKNGSESFDDFSSPGENPAVTNFRQFLRINTAHPHPDYEKAVHWLRKQADSIGLEFNYLQFKEPDLFACWLTWRGSKPSLKSILLNSHMDVVAVDRPKWIPDPFGAFKDWDWNGNIYARGSQDMKSTIVARLEAIRTLKKEGFIPVRNVHLSAMPDEELGGMHGMQPFVNSRQFRSLNIGFDMDESSASLTDTMLINYAQKNAWQIKVTANGTPGHGSSAANGTAGVKINIVIDKLMEFRQQQITLMENTPGYTPDDITTVNLVILKGGIANNVLPDSLSAVFDIRIRPRPNWTFTDMENLLDSIMEQAGTGVTYEFLQKSLDTDQTAMDETNPWWMNLKATFDQENWKYTKVFLGPTTDTRYVRRVGIPSLGINPGVFLAENLIHQDNEYLNENVFLGQIDRYVTIFRSLTMMSGNITP